MNEIIARLFDCPPHLCSCGELCLWQVEPVEDRFVWADTDGHTVVPSGVPSPYEFMADVAGRVEAATTGPKRSRGPMPSDLELQAYSVLVGNVNALGRPDLHRHDPCPHNGAHRIEGFEHCGWPMHLRPSGWHCRQRCGAVLPLEV